MLEYNYDKCPECGYINNRKPDICPVCGCDLREYREKLRKKELYDIEMAKYDVIYHQAITDFNCGKYLQAIITFSGIENHRESKLYLEKIKAELESQGLGFKIYDDKSVYMGGWKNGQPEGHGIRSYVNKNQFEGEWADGEMTKGIMKYASGDTYSGEWKNEKCDGHGTSVSKSTGDRYEGEWKNGLREGIGTYVWGDGDSYEGEWKNGSREGQGKMVWASGDSYEGFWKDDCFHDIGVKCCSDGSCYDCTWIKGKIDTNEVSHIKYSNGDLFSGELDGKCGIIYANGNRYYGECKHEKPNGYGRMFYSNGDFYEGEWVDGCHHGHGVLTCVNDSKKWIIRELGLVVGRDANDVALNLAKIIGVKWDADWNGNLITKGIVILKNGVAIGVKFDNSFTEKITYRYYDRFASYDDDLLRVYNAKIEKEKAEKSKLITQHLELDDGYYDGETKDGKRHGYGVMVYDSGDRYEGEWKNDERDGKGICTWPEEYYSEFLEEICPNPYRSYEGEWKNDSIHGFGIMMDWENNKCEGFWDDICVDHEVCHQIALDVVETTGRLDSNNGYYEGEIKDGKMHGKGTYVFNSGDRYEGYWNDGVRHGSGVYRPNGDKFEGVWVNGKKNGYGLYTFSNGSSTVQLWRNGEQKKISI